MKHQIAFAGARKVDELRLDDLPTGRVTRLMVAMADNALGRPMRVPVLVAKGGKPGPTFGLTAALHGDELNGIAVIHRLFANLDVEKLRGNVVGAVILNLPGYFGQMRHFGDGADLNHLFPGKADGNDSQVWTHRLMDRIICKLDMLVDLHTASFGRVNSLYVRADMSNPVVAQMARLQRPQIILDNPPSDTTLRGAAQELGINAVTVEIGDPQRFQQAMIRRSLTGVRAVMAEHGLTRRRKPVDLPPTIVCGSSSWSYTDSGGLLEVFPKVTERVQEGEVVARLTNVFGDLTREYRAATDGIVIGKSTNPVAQTGARILHLGREV